MKLYLIRHGLTPSMGQGLFLGSTDEPLSHQGQQQIDRLRRQLCDVPLQSVLSSPLQRARESAALFCRDRKMTVQIANALAERNFGVFERHSYGELLQSHPELIADWNAEPWIFEPPGGESAEIFRQRVAGFLFDTLLQTIPHNHEVALFTHLGVIRVLLAEAMHLQRDQIWRFAVAPGHAVELEFDSEGYAFVHWD